MKRIMLLMLLFVFCMPLFGQDFNIGDHINVSGLFEAELGMAANGDTVQDIVLATGEIDIGAQINEHVFLNAVYLWEEDDTEPVSLDEGYMTIAQKGFTVKAGRKVIPFGTFETFLVSDPLTLELGETHESCILCGFEYKAVLCELGVFNGDIGIDEGTDDVINNIVAAVTYSPLKWLTIHASFIVNIGDTDSVQDELAVTDIQNAVNGIAVSVTGTRDPFSFACEYVGSLETFEQAELDIDGDGDGDSPWVLNAEAAYTIMEGLQAGVRVAATGECIGLPESQVGAGLSYDIWEGSTLAVEISVNSFDDDISEDDITAAVVQFALAF